MNVDHPAAEEFLMHHGIKGMKWGVRRTPQQLGHAVTKKLPSGEKKAQKPAATKTPGKAFRKSTSISDEELQKRINRLNMEERYEDLVSRQKAREGGIWKNHVAPALVKGGDQLLGIAVSKLVTKMTSPKETHDISDVDEASTSDLKRATDWLSAKKAYEEARNPDATKSATERYQRATNYLNAKKSYEEARNPKPKNVQTDYRSYDYSKASDEELGRIMKRISTENTIVKLLRDRVASK